MSQSKKPDGVEERRVDPSGTNYLIHQEAQGFRRAGVWTSLGERHPNYQWRLRPFWEEVVVVRKGAVEAEICRMQGMEPEDAVVQLRGNRAAVVMAITGLRGKEYATPEMLLVARENGWTIQEGSFKHPKRGITQAEQIVLEGNEDPAQVRKLVELMLTDSTPLLQTLIGASRGLHKCADTEVVALGEGFVYGLGVAPDWAD